MAAVDRTSHYPWLVMFPRSDEAIWSDFEESSLSVARASRGAPARLEGNESEPTLTALCIHLSTEHDVARAARGRIREEELEGSCHPL